jgi:hypothetical protein
MRTDIKIHGNTNNKGKRQIKYVVLPIEFYRNLIKRLEDQSDLRTIKNAQKEPLYDQKKRKHTFIL